MDRLRQAWNAFRGYEEERAVLNSAVGPTVSYTVDRSRRTTLYNDRTIVTSVLNRISVDAAGILMKHVKVDDNGRYLDDMKSPLNECLVSFEANIDQSPRHFKQDAVMTMLEVGCAALVPVDTTIDPNTNEIFDIYTLRVGTVVNWYPRHVKVNVYNDRKGVRQDIIQEKRIVAIVENPLRAVMNEPNSTLQRLISKLQLLDTTDEAAASGKLDLIIQLPYAIKSEARREMAAKRREELEFQLRGSKYGIAYTDGTEKVIQLNRPAENQLLKQIEYFTQLLYGQLGITPEVMNGTADEATMINYYNRTVEPIVEAMQQAMQRAFLGLLKVRDNERIAYFRQPFKFTPISQIAELIDVMSRNEIASPNDIRQEIGMVPSKDPKADELRNSNMPQEDSGSLVSIPKGQSK